MSRPATTSHRGEFVDVRCRLENDTREVLCEQTRARWQVGRHGAGRCQIASQIDDPGVDHGSSRNKKDVDLSVVAQRRSAVSTTAVQALRRARLDGLLLAV